MPDFKSHQWFNLSTVILMEASFVQIDTAIGYSKRQSFLLLNFTVMPCLYFVSIFLLSFFLPFFPPIYPGCSTISSSAFVYRCNSADLVLAQVLPKHSFSLIRPIGHHNHCKIISHDEMRQNHRNFFIYSFYA